MKKEFRTMIVSYAYHEIEGKSISVPYIRIKGKWLQELGFLQGQKICVQAINKKLIITIDKPA